MDTTKTETRGRPKIYATATERYRANNLRKKELHPEKYKEHGSKKRPARYCDVCQRFYEYHAFSKHLNRRNHLKNLSSAETNSTESN